MEEAVVADGVLPGGSKREPDVREGGGAGHLVMTLSCSRPPCRELKEEPTLENLELFELLKTCGIPKPGRGNST